MSLYQTLYFMSIVGGIAGVAAWSLVNLIGAALPNQAEQWVSDLIAVCALGALIGGLTVGFSDRWSGNRVSWRWICSGSMIGLLAGFLAGCVQMPITSRLGLQSPILNRLIAWMLAGSMIGLGLGLRWASNRNRVLYTTAGGLLGGMLGGFVFSGLHGVIPDLSQAIGYMAVGVGICFGVTLAPILLRDGVLQFISSGDPRAQMKFGLGKKQWELSHGGSYLIGSESGALSRTMYKPGLEIFLPDAMVAAHHAILFSKQGRFFIGRHPSASTPAALARYVVRVRGESVINTRELHHSDDLLIGRTALRFSAKGDVA